MNLPQLVGIVGIAAATSIGAPSSTASANSYNQEPEFSYTKDRPDAPNIELTDLDNKVQQLSDYFSNGKPTLVNFWATWCPPCRAEIPALDDFTKRYKGRVDVVALSDEPLKTIEGYVSNGGFEHIKFYSKVDNPYNVQGIPTTFLIDREGKVIGYHVGASSFKNDGIEAAVIEALKK